MEYVDLLMRVPSGHEKAIQAVVMAKIDSILAQSILQPSELKKAEYASEVDKSYTENKIPNPKK